MSNAYILVTIIISFAISASLGFVLIPFLRKLKFGQTILDIGPAWHKKKEGTPTMGGILFITATVVSFFIVLAAKAIISDNTLMSASSTIFNTRLYAGLLMALCFGMIGFFDDYIKIVKKQNEGLTAMQKTVLQTLVTAGYLLSLALAGDTIIDIPFIGSVDVGLWYWPIAFITIYGFVNAVNLTDGVDGLAGSVTMIAAIAFMIISTSLMHYDMSLLSAALIGGCAGFLVWNFHPAKVFMGDTGSMFLGGMVVALSFGTGRPILIFFIGILYLIEAFSVVIQVTYYKFTHKRLFKMSPIHHHFEMSGWSEYKIVFVFSLVTLIGCVIAVASIVGRW